MATKVEAAHLMMVNAARLKDSGERNDVEAGMAKLLACEYCDEVTQDSFRIHGGYGYSKEYEIERLMREAPILLIGEGTSEIQKTIIGRGLLREYKPALMGAHRCSPATRIAGHRFRYECDLAGVGTSLRCQGVDRYRYPGYTPAPATGGPVTHTVRRSRTHRARAAQPADPAHRLAGRLLRHLRGGAAGRRLPRRPRLPGRATSRSSGST